MIRILIADDQGGIRQGLKPLLGVEGEFEVVGEAQDGLEAVEKARALQPDIVLLDLLISNISGIEAIAAIVRAVPTTRVLALTSVLDDELVFDAIRVGAMGCLLKDTPPDSLRMAIQAAAAGKVQLEPRIAQRLVNQASDDDSAEPLTPRETEVLRLIATGMTNQQIGKVLGISDNTVRNHASSILSKLDVLNRTEAALYAMRTGLVSGGAQDRVV